MGNEVRTESPPPPVHAIVTACTLACGEGLSNDPALMLPAMPALQSITSRDGVERYGNTDRRPSAAGEPSFTITPRGGRGSFADATKGGTTPPGSARTGWDSQKGVVGGARTSRDSQVGLPGTVRTGRDTQMGLPLTVRTSRDGQVGLPLTVGTSRDSHVGLPGVEAAGGRTDAVVVIQVASPLMPASDLAGADDVIPLEEVLAP